MKLSADERELLANAGIDFPVDEMGEPSQELEIAWDEARATFDFEIDPDADKTQDEEAALEGKLKLYELVSADPNVDAFLQQSGKMLDRGELIADIASQLSDNDKIIRDITSEEQEALDAQQQGIDPATGMPIEQPMEEELPPEAIEGEMLEEDPEKQQFIVNLEAVMEQHAVDENIATAMLIAEKEGFEPEEIEQLKQMLLKEAQARQPQEAVV